MATGTDPSSLAAVILAAGKGTRMRSARPKVLHEVAGRPLLAWVLDAARASGCRRCLVVVGHGADQIRQAFADEEIVWVEQREQLGTGHALAQARPHFEEAERVLVLSGDVPAIRAETLESLIAAADGGWGAMTVAEMGDPGTLGRVVLNPDRSLKRIVEAADASEDELALETVNAGIYVLPSGSIFGYLDRLEPDNAKGELYLTDALVAAARSERIATVRIEDWREALGVNDRRDLARVHDVLITRHLEALMTSGVTIYDPARTVIEPSVEVGPDSEIHPNVTLAGNTVIGSECTIETGAWIRDSRIDAGVAIGPYTVVDGAIVRTGASIGPFARLRPGTEVGRAARVGNFVEVKNARLGEGVKAGHLAYLGDAQIGDQTNIGAGAVTCNYDGSEKHRTTIGREVFIGSDTMLVAPVEVGDEAVTAAGSVITNDVPAGALGVGRHRQRNVDGWSKRRRKRNE